ncbi:MAG: ABC transporter substrate-binding protein [Pseudomonadota bacterium]
MERRGFVALIGGALALPRLAFAQERGKVHRVVYLSPNPVQTVAPLMQALLEGLRELGYTQGRNLAFEIRHADGKLERLPEVARELVASKPDVIVTGINITTHAVRRLTRTIPIVMAVGTGVVEDGLVASLARPGGNVTGVTWDVGLEVMPKRFDFLKEAVPNLSRVAVLWDQGQDTREFKGAIEQGGAAAGLTLIWIDYDDDHEQMFKAAAREKAQAVFTSGGGRFFRHRKVIVELAAKYRLPDSHYSAEFVEAGGLISYAPNLANLFKRTAVYVDKILRGANPAELPVERPIRLELLINLKTAKALGVTVPQSLLLRADRVIE